MGCVLQTSRDILDTIHAPIRDLFTMVEKEFHPLTLCNRVWPSPSPQQWNVHATARGSPRLRATVFAPSPPFR